MKSLIFFISLMAFYAVCFAKLEIDVNCSGGKAANVTRNGRTFLYPDVSRYQLKDTAEGIRFTRDRSAEDTGGDRFAEELLFKKNSNGETEVYGAYEITVHDGERTDFHQYQFHGDKNGFKVTCLAESSIL